MTTYVFTDSKTVRDVVIGTPDDVKMFLTTTPGYKELIVSPPTMPGWMAPGVKQKAYETMKVITSKVDKFLKEGGELRIDPQEVATIHPDERSKYSEIRGLRMEPSHVHDMSGQRRAVGEMAAERKLAPTVQQKIQKMVGLSRNNKRKTRRRV